MNTDTMYGNMPLYAYVYIGIRRKVALPLYLRKQHIQGYRDDVLKIECYSEAEVSWYKELCFRMSHWVVLLCVEYIELLEDGYIDYIDGGGNLEFTPETIAVREHVDGKVFGEVTIRETYQDKEF